MTKIRYKDTENFPFLQMFYQLFFRLFTKKPHNPQKITRFKKGHFYT